MEPTPKTAMTQIERAAKVLTEELHPVVTTQDRKDAVAELGCSMITVILYLNGSCRNLDTAMKLINFFRSKVAERDRALAS